MTKLRIARLTKFRSWFAGFCAVVLLGTAGVVAQNCDNVRLAMLKTEQASVTSSLFGDLQPVLAVRKTACIMCHAQINGDVVTDFGYGDPFFMGTDDVGNHPTQTDYGPFTSKHFIGSGVTWSGSAIMGNVYVPDADIKDQRLLESFTNTASGNAALAGTLKLVDFLNGKFIDPTIDVATPVSLIAKTASTDITVPGLRGNFISRKSILIDSPTSDEIKNLELGTGAVQVYAKPGVVIFKGKQLDSITGLSAVQSQKTGKLILTNGDSVVCRGDVIIEGVLFLNNLNLDTDSAGCRMYVAGTVFIQGPITYINGGDSNLQISSSRGIIMGMRDLNTRLTSKGALPTLSGIRQAPTESTEAALYQAIMTDRDSVDNLTNDAGPFQVMVDSTQTKLLAIQNSFDDNTWTPGSGQTTFPDPTTCATGTPASTDPCAINWSGGYALGIRLRKTVNYTHLLLNAPTVQSRYFGVFQGVVIAEDVLFAVNNFQFSKDPVMLRTPLLPLIQDRIFKMTNF